MQNDCLKIFQYVFICFVMYMFSEEVYSPEELLAMIFNASRQFAQDYAGTYTCQSVHVCIYCARTYVHVYINRCT